MNNFYVWGRKNVLSKENYKIFMFALVIRIYYKEKIYISQS